MIALFTKSKHYQIFIAYLGISLLVNFLFAKPPKNDGLFEMQGPPLSPWVFVVAISTLALWLWSIGTYSYRQVENIVQWKKGLFNFTSFYPILYVSYLSYELDVYELENFTPELFQMIMIAHTALMFCLLYNSMFAARAFKTAETGRVAKFQDYAGEFFMILFYIIGFWILQPRVNKLCEEDAGEYNY